MIIEKQNQMGFEKPETKPETKSEKVDNTALIKSLKSEVYDIIRLQDRYKIELDRLEKLKIERVNKIDQIEATEEARKGAAATANS